MVLSVYAYTVSLNYFGITISLRVVKFNDLFLIIVIVGLDEF